jgi:hypothetical protein
MISDPQGMIQYDIVLKMIISPVIRQDFQLDASAYTIDQICCTTTKC